MTDIKTRYGVCVGLVKDREIYLSRRIDTKTFPKKWQIVNGYLKDGFELSYDAATRIIEQETGIHIDSPRMFSAKTLTLPGSSEFYYVFLVHLAEDETPAPVDEKEMNHSEWKSFPLDKAIVLDMVPGLRKIIRSLKLSLKKYEEGNKKATQKIDTTRFTDTEASIWY